MSTRSVFLDFGGTLVEPDPDPYPALRAILLPLGIEVSPERYADAEGRAAARIGPIRYQLLGQHPSYLDRGNIEMLKELGVSDPDGTLVSHLHEVYTSPDWRHPLPGTLDALATLRGLSVTLHLVSNSSDMLLESLSRLGWDRLFKTVTFSQEAGAEKPDKRVFDLALKRAGCGPEDVVHVGDSWTADYRGAREAGLRAIWFNRGGLPPPEPCAEIHNLKDLPQQLGLA